MWTDRRRVGAAMLVAAAFGACARGPAPGGEPGAGAPARSTVALLVEGSAFDQAPVRDQVAIVVAAATGRPVETLAKEPSFESVLGPVAKRVARESGGGARGEVRECRKKARPIVTAIAVHADAVYRIRLVAKPATRPATDADRAELGKAEGLGGMLSAMARARPDTVFETRLDGAIERTTFAGTPATTRQQIRWVARALGTKAAPPPLDAREAVTNALARMTPAPASRWDAVSRSLTMGGCPLVGHAVADVYVDDAAAKRRLRTAAVAAMSAQVAKRAEVAETPADAAPEPEPLPDPGPHTEPAATPSEPAYSCATLCGLHMVELCNNDRTLWSQHGSRWESTRCGVRRPEDFLAECYRMHWLSGTYERSCIQPCQETSEGRARLETLLRRAGCLRGGA